jgi:hypothetical protein
MFQDIGVSKTLIVEYKEYCEIHQVTGLGTTDFKNIIHKTLLEFRLVDVSVMVLSSNSWHFSASPNIILPIEVRHS